MKRLLPVLLLVWSADAAAQLDSGYYLGAQVGQMDYREGGFGLTIDDTVDSYKLYGGFRFDDIWALEAHYGQTGDLTTMESAVVPDVGTFFADITADWRILEVRGIAHINAFFAGVGYWDGDIDVRLDITDPEGDVTSASGSTSDSGYSVVIGAEWEFSQWAIRAEYEYFDAESDVDMAVMGIGAHFKF